MSDLKTIDLKTFETVSVIGAGTMGAGIAQVVAQQGIPVCLYDVQEEFINQGIERVQGFLAKGLEKGKITQDMVDSVQANLRAESDLKKTAQSALVIEAAPEDLALKQKLFGALDEHAPSQTILASNTSSLSITAIGAATQRPEQVAGLHFFNPVPLMRLVEVIQGQQTSDETVDQLVQFSELLGKVPAVAQDTPGFIVNRVARPFYGEAFRLLGEGTASVETIDAILKKAGGFRMGPFELMDLIGVDVNFAVTQSVYEAYFHEPRYKPHVIQQRMVEAGTLGRKTGKGFYTYDT